MNASTKPNKAETETVRITKGTVSGSGSGSETDPVIIGSDSTGAELSVSSATANTTVHCTLTDTGSAASKTYSGNPVTVPLPLNGAGEKQYKLEYYTDGEGFAATPVKTVYYKVLQGYTVTFDANGEAYLGGSNTVSKTVLHENTVSVPNPLPVKQGWGVTGWYKDVDCSAGQEWNFATDTVTSNITLYAQWTAGVVSYKVEHYQQNIADDNYPASPANTDPKTGITDASISADSIKRDYPGFEYDHIEPADPKINGDGSTLVKVYYTRKPITVTFNLDGGKIGEDPSNVERKGKYGAAFTPPAASTVKKPGYIGSSWLPVGDAPALSSTFPAKNAEYKPNWAANTYYVQFQGNGNTSGDMSRQTFTYDVLQKLSKNLFKKTGYTFKGWAETTTGPVKYDDEAEVSNLTPDAGTTVTLNAVWEENHYKVRFHGNGGTGNMDDQELRNRRNA